MIKKYVRSGSIVLDIGAHIGTHSLTLANAVGKGGKCYAFEPNKKIFWELCFNIARNKVKNILPLRLALGKEISTIETVTPLSINEGGTFIIHRENLEKASVQLRLDDLELNNISLIKIDVENMEADVIEGGIETILRNRPILIVEIQGNN